MCITGPRRREEFTGLGDVAHSERGWKFSMNFQTFEGRFVLGWSAERLYAMTDIVAQSSRKIVLGAERDFHNL